VKNHVLWAVAVSALLPPTLAAQDPPSRPKFEVASVKECKDTDRPPPSTNSPGRLSLSCWQLKRLILQAYEVYADGEVDPVNPFLPLTPMEGDPDWISSARYSIDAKAESPQSAAMMMGPMMQTLLEDRFQLRMHRETREVPVYIMTVAKGGPKLQPTKESSCMHIDPTDFAQPPLPAGRKPCAFTTRINRGSTIAVGAYGITLGVYAKALNPGRPVIDRTGITGVFDIFLEYPAESLSASAPDGSTARDPGSPLITALREQLGLRLDPGKGPREFLVLDRIARPSGN
jgi:uncharacterized protein (TIGR03435 family)